MSRKNLVSCLTAILVALTLIFSSTQIAFANEESDKHNAQGEKHYNEKKYDETIKEFNAAIAIDPNNAEYYNNRGLAYKAQWKNEEADVRAYEAQMENEKANKGRLEDSLFRHHLMLNLCQEMYDKAMKDFLTAGKMYFNKEDYDKAKDAFDNALIVDGIRLDYAPDDIFDDEFDDSAVDESEGEAHFWLGEVESRLTERNLSDWQKAIGKYDEAIRLGFVEDLVFTARGRAKHELKDYDAALENFTTAVDIDAIHAEAYRNLLRVERLRKSARRFPKIS